MNIGFDLDKIFIDYPPFVPDFIINKLYKKKKNGILLYRIPSKAEQIFRLITHYKLFRPPIVQNMQSIRNIVQEKKHKHYLISSRFGFLEKTTNAIIKKHGFDKIFDNMYFNFKNKQPHLFKDEIIKKLKIDRYVDDDLPLLKFLANRNQNSLFFWLNKHQRRKILKNLFSVTHISDMIHHKE